MDVAGGMTVLLFVYEVGDDGIDCKGGRGCGFNGCLLFPCREAVTSRRGCGCEGLSVDRRLKLLM